MYGIVFWHVDIDVLMHLVLFVVISCEPSVFGCVLLKNLMLITLFKGNGGCFADEGQWIRR